MQAEFNKENLVKNLPDAYKKNNESNNFKILEVERIECANLRDDLQSINEILDINNATGKTLDRYGERVGQPRGLATDAKYLLMIKAKIMRNLSNGSYQSIIDALCETFSCDPSEVYIQDEDEPCTVKLVSLPLAFIIGAGLSTSQTVAIIKSMLPVGVSLSTFLFEGTFEFADRENEQDTEKGFCDIEGGTMGGYLGATDSDLTDEILPI